MAWDAGAITGSLGLDVSEYAHGMLQAEGLMQAFPSVVTEFLENPLLGFISLTKETAEAAVEMDRKLVETLSEVASHAQALGLDALKSGVSVQFFEGLEIEAKRVGVSADEIGNSFRFLERNAVAATEGNQQAAQGFAALGISLDFLQAHLGDSETMFNAVREGINSIATPAERTRAALQVLGREGAGMIPLFLQSNEAMKEHKETAEALGNVETDASVKSAQGWFKVTAAIDDMWEGLKKTFAAAFIKSIDDNWDVIRQTIIDLSRLLKEVIPAAVFVAVSSLELLLLAMAKVAEGMRDIAAIGIAFNLPGFTPQLGSELANITADLNNLLKPVDDILTNLERASSTQSTTASPTAPAVTQNFHFDVNANFDENVTSSQVAAKLAPAIKDAVGKMQLKAQKIAEHDAVSKAVGGRNPKFYVAGQ